jgi:hypothetical protein
VPREHKGQLVHRVPKVVRVFKGQQDSLDFKVLRGHLVRPAPQGSKGHKEQSVLQVLKDQQVQQAQQEQQGQLD